MLQTIHSVNLDANESIFFARELEAVKAQTYDIKYPELKAQRMIPVSTDAGPGAQSITYQQFDSVGIMKVIASYADDLPRADTKGREFTCPVKSLGGAYSYSIQDIRSAQKAGRPIDVRKAAAERQAYEQAVNRIAWLAKATDPTYGGLQGLIFNPNITKGNALTGTWSSASADQIVADVNDLITKIKTVSKGVESADVVLMPPAQYGLIASKPRSTGTDTTVLEFLRRVHPGVSFEELNECAALAPTPMGAAGPKDIALAFRRSPMNLTLELPQLFEQFPPQERNLEFLIPCHARIGGVIVYYPLSVNLIEGI